MENIHSRLQETIQTLYRKSIDADRQLNNLQQNQKGKFQAIFNSDSHFKTSSKRFAPYVKEITEDWQQLKDENEQAFQAKLPILVKKIELALITIEQFNQSLKK